MLQYVLLGIAVVVLLSLLAVFVEKIKHKKSTQLRQKKNSETSTENFIVNCPLCGSHLGPGENLVSKVWRPMNVPEQRIIISGCPHCFPVCEPGIQRSCPRCHKAVPQDGHLVAHLFNLPMGKKHVTVTGCTSCCKYEKKQSQ